MRTRLACLSKESLHAWVIVLEGTDMGSGQIWIYLKCTEPQEKDAKHQREISALYLKNNLLIKWLHGDSHYWWDCKNGTALLENSLPDSWKTKHTLTIIQYWTSTLFVIYSEKLKTYVHTKKLQMFTCNCQSLEATKTSFNRWMDKLWYIWTMEYYSVLKRSKLSSHEETRSYLKCIVLSERCQSEQATHCMTPLYDVWKRHCYGEVKRSEVARSWKLREGQIGEA